MTSISIKDVDKYLDEEIQRVLNCLSNEVSEDKLDANKAVRLSTEMKTLKAVKLYINKEE